MELKQHLHKRVKVNSDRREGVHVNVPSIFVCAFADLVMTDNTLTL